MKRWILKKAVTFKKKYCNETTFLVLQCFVTLLKDPTTKFSTFQMETKKAKKVEGKVQWWKLRRYNLSRVHGVRLPGPKHEKGRIWPVSKSPNPQKTAKFYAKICKNNQNQSYIFMKYYKFCSDFSETGLKTYYFLQYSKRQNNGRMAKSFYVWQTLTKAKFVWFFL